LERKIRKKHSTSHLNQTQATNTLSSGIYKKDFFLFVIYRINTLFYFPLGLATCKKCSRETYFVQEDSTTAIQIYCDIWQTAVCDRCSQTADCCYILFPNYLVRTSTVRQISLHTTATTTTTTTTKMIMHYYYYYYYYYYYVEAGCSTSGPDSNFSYGNNSKVTVPKFKRLNLHPNIYIQMQKVVILGTSSIVRNFLNYI
jgi:hypothetical protein